MSEGVRVEAAGRLGVLTLDRPEALNALSLAMIRRLDAALAAWAAAPGIDAVLIRGAGERAFCAGGDVRALFGLPEGAGAGRLRRDFFAGEYRLNYRIHSFHKPYVALIDGIAMGGGCGVSLHASHVVTTPRTAVAMPETRIGLSPDVGATWFLNRLPGELGIHAGLTGLRLDAGDLHAFGLAGHHVAAGSGPAIRDALAALPRLDRAAIDDTLGRFAVAPGASALAPQRAEIDAAFAGATLEAIRQALDAVSAPWAAAARAAIDRAAPLPLKVALRQLRAGRSLAVRRMFEIEYRLAVRLSDRADFGEGVRALLIDKDNAPRWQPASLAAVAEEAVAACFAPLAPDEPELTLD